MKLQLPWGPGTLALDVPDTWNMVLPSRMPVPGRKMMDELSLVRDSISRPIDAPSLAKRRLKGAKVVVIVDDNTRPTPVHRFFHLILESLTKSGVSLKNVTVIPALGIHTPMNENEMAAKIGPKNLKQVRWENHDAFRLEANYYFGTTDRGTPVYLNRRLKDADLVVLVGLVEPHLWAGFGGGMKNILPGVAYSETIGAPRDHRRAAVPLQPRGRHA